MSAQTTKLRAEVATLHARLRSNVIEIMNLRAEVSGLTIRNADLRELNSRQAARMASLMGEHQETAVEEAARYLKGEELPPKVRSENSERNIEPHL